MNMMFRKVKHNVSGQGIVEVMVAIGVVTVGLVGTLSLTSSSLRFSTTSEKQIVAANLAREGIEVVRNVRDTNWLQENSWLDGLTSGDDYNGIIRFDGTTNTWYFDFTPDDILNNNTVIRRDGNDIYQAHPDVPTAVSTGYQRFISMQLICQQGASIVLRSSGSTCPGGYTHIGLNIQSQVNWNENGEDKSFVLEDDIYNWR